MLGERTAEEIKMAIGSAFPAPDEPHAEIRGRDLVSGLPKTIVVSAEEIRKAIEEPVNSIIDAVKTTLDKCPRELSGDVMDRGIVITGGGALLKGLDERLRHQPGRLVRLPAPPPVTGGAWGARSAGARARSWDGWRVWPATGAGGVGPRHQVLLAEPRP